MSHLNGVGADPTALPIFAPAPPPVLPRPGRVRSRFTMHGITTAPQAPSAAAAPPHFMDTTGPHLPRSAAAGELDWTLVAAFRSQVSERMAQALGEDRRRMDKGAQEELGRSIIVDLLEASAAASLSGGADTWSPQEQDALAEAVFNAAFRLGRLQPLVDDDQVENIIITGHDKVLLETVDGQQIPGPAVADSDEELIDFLRFLASRSEANARSFAESQPSLDLRLDGGARLAATAWVTPHPAIVIRRHRLRRVRLADLVERGAMSAVAASFLRAAVVARKSIVVGGSMGSGKTTMVRALCAEIPREEAIGTFETEYELFLNEQPDKHVIAWEARPGTGERGPDGRQAGEFTLDEALRRSFRYNLSRQIVGEVRGSEVWAMIKAMESGTGSISTTHASNAQACIRKLVTCAMEAGPHVSHELATSKLSECIDIVVQLHMDTTWAPDGTARRRRWVSEIITVEPGEKEKGYATTHVFGPSLDGPAQATGLLPEEYRDLTGYGFDIRGYLAEGHRREAAT